MTDLRDMSDERIRDLCEKAMALDPTYRSPLCAMLAAELRSRLAARQPEPVAPIKVRVEVIR